jgi:hypothetical protein
VELALLKSKKLWLMMVEATKGHPILQLMSMEIIPLHNHFLAALPAHQLN